MAILVLSGKVYRSHDRIQPCLYLPALSGFSGILNGVVAGCANKGGLLWGCVGKGRILWGFVDCILSWGLCVDLHFGSLKGSHLLQDLLHDTGNEILFQEYRWKKKQL